MWVVVNGRVGMDGWMDGWNHPHSHTIDDTVHTPNECTHTHTHTPDVSSRIKITTMWDVRAMDILYIYILYI